MTPSKRIMKLDLVAGTYKPADRQFQDITSVKITDLASLFSESFAGTVDDEQETLEEWCEEIRAFSLNKYGPFINDASFVVTHDDMPIAAITCSLFKNVPLITYIVTHPNFQRQSLGKELLNKLIASLKSLQYTTVYLVASNNNLPAISLYESMGFQSFDYNWDAVLNNSPLNLKTQ
ncbi:GNAT family N-acetyltransferase [Vagococcus sp. BWB3-3]|uniref:GNAT family N-acetyltransferase n=1 Tax=Vagococcus allomyrinae TaxID=2794353 RepID=A0A940SX19_9ENTE|nr:GNAT family N-acetyltransferase [Vagococcus allomyrinae]MBP1041923.1 GNAT family N-acetyltransferase [Vagococcus allomyrinae]